MRWLFGRTEPSGDCACCVQDAPESTGVSARNRTDTRTGGTLVVDASDCPGDGRLADASACRRTVVEALRDRDVQSVVTRAGGRERAYLDDDAALLCAAGRFVDRARVHDERLADRAVTDPVGAADEATGRAGPVSRIAAETGLALCARRIGSVASLTPYVGPTIGHTRVARDPPPEGRLRDSQQLSTGATVRLYDREEGLAVYHVEPPAATLDDDEMRLVGRARELVADGTVTGTRAAWRAVRTVADEDAAVDLLGRILHRHTAGYGVFTDCFDDPRVTDVFATAPVPANPLRVRVDGELATTNVRVCRRSVDALASRFRRESGRAFSRASPTLDATTTVGDRRVRIAATTAPVSDGPAFALRAHDRTVWTLPQLVDNGTIPPDAAALLSLSVDRAAATLVAGPRGAGKTTLLGALLWELDPGVRTLVIEDTPELPVTALQADGRDVQSLVTERGDGPGLPDDEALRTALRLGESALAVGEVRGEEAQVLYEAMRVGAGGSAVLGTIHGDGGDDVRERVVADLDVPPSSFATTDLVVTTGCYEDDGQRRRRVTAIEEVVSGADGPAFESLYRLEDGQLRSTGRLDRGNSDLLATLADSSESYAAVRNALDRRAAAFRDGERRVEPRTRL
jgi:type IV secretory pathway ATPase VirB11/archaellum biosynthesis ATPase